ncbi:MAG: RNase adapter RapZ [Clostridia bacterium]
MKFVIVTGLSGAGKSKAIASMEDIGFYCVDNLPPTMIPIFYDLCQKSPDTLQKIAVVTDTRGGELFKSFFDALATLESQNREYKILFLDASDTVLVNRYQETRRKHPLSDSVLGSLENAVKLEREMLKPVKERADYIINTTSIKAQSLKSRITKMFAEEEKNPMMVHCMSFGFKHGMPIESDLVFDVRCLPNPHYIDELRPKTGLDDVVYNYVMEKDDAKTFISKIIDMLDFSIPLYQKEGKSQLVVSIGCTGGHHRSVSFARYIHNYLSTKNYNVTVNHRDITK